MFNSQDIKGNGSIFMKIICAASISIHYLVDWNIEEDSIQGVKEVLHIFWIWTILNEIVMVFF